MPLRLPRHSLGEGGNPFPAFYSCVPPSAAQTATVLFSTRPLKAVKFRTEVLRWRYPQFLGPSSKFASSASARRSSGRGVPARPGRNWFGSLGDVRHGQIDLYSTLRRERARPSELDSRDRVPRDNLIVGLLDGGATRPPRRSCHRLASGLTKVRPKRSHANAFHVTGGLWPRACSTVPSLRTTWISHRSLAGCPKH
jgi:hypothetical protein